MLFVWGSKGVRWEQLGHIGQITRSVGIMTQRWINSGEALRRAKKFRLRLATCNGALLNCSITLLRELRVQWWHSNGLGLRRLLSIARELGSADPYDRVYAMLGLASRAYAIKPDYTLRDRPRDVCIRAAKSVHCCRSQS
jgi:hypothetical protein